MKLKKGLDLPCRYCGLSTTDDILSSYVIWCTGEDGKVYDIYVVHTGFCDRHEKRVNRMKNPMRGEYSDSLARFAAHFPADWVYLCRDYEFTHDAYNTLASLVNIITHPSRRLTQAETERVKQERKRLEDM